MSDDDVSFIVTLWFAVVVFVLTAFVLLKIGGWVFNFRPAPVRTIVQQMYHDCLENTESNHSDQCTAVLKDAK